MDALGADGGDADEHEVEQEQAHASEDAPHERLLHEPGAQTHERERHGQDAHLRRKRDAARFLEGGHVGAVHLRRDDPGMAARRRLREQERREQQQRGGGQHRHEHADASDDAGGPGADEHEEAGHAVHRVSVSFRRKRRYAGI